jgi:hypothetical protein
MPEDRARPLAVETDGLIPCDYCNTTDDVAVIYAVPGKLDPRSDAPEWHGFICSRCAAQAIQVTTGFKVERMLEVMYRQRANARNIRLVEPC